MAVISNRFRAPRRQFTRRSRALALLGAMVVATSLVVSGCGSGSSGNGVAKVASTGSGTTAANDSASSKKADPAAFSACMRKHGVTDFPDPDSQGRIRITGGQSANGQQTGVDPQSPAFIAAQHACQSLMPNGGKQDPQQQAKDVQAMLAFARCMRSHGVAKFPDPKVAGNGGVQLSINANSGVDPGSPVFQSAQKACQSLQPHGAGLHAQVGPS
jgi:hypothetical protein